MSRSSSLRSTHSFQRRTASGPHSRSISSFIASAFWPIIRREDGRAQRKMGPAHRLAPASLGPGESWTTIICREYKVGEHRRRAKEGIESNNRLTSAQVERLGPLWCLDASTLAGHSRISQAPFVVRSPASLNRLHLRSGEQSKILLPKA